MGEGRGSRGEEDEIGGGAGEWALGDDGHHRHVLPGRSDWIGLGRLGALHSFTLESCRSPSGGILSVDFLKACMKFIRGFLRDASGFHRRFWAWSSARRSEAQAIGFGKAV